MSHSPECEVLDPFFSRSSGDLLQLCFQLRSPLPKGPGVQQHNALLNGKSLKITLHIPYIELFDPPKMDNLQYWSLIIQQYHGNSIGIWSSCDTSCLIFDVHRQCRQPPAVHPRNPPSKHHRWPPGCLSLWQKDNLFAIDPPAFEESTWRTNHPEMAGS